ncbi:unnamed protein product [Rangifer tarandus platyrhynchus]|uniref:Uncharacterized protein n=1 Tax=Rangifer tarandus platyrhynchus TaxID=3082113 RepID=A0AC59ZLH3_RANTA
MCVPGQYVYSTRAQTPCAARLRKKTGGLVCSSCGALPALAIAARPAFSCPRSTWKDCEPPRPTADRCSWLLNTDSRKPCPSWTSATRFQWVGRTLARFLLTRIVTSEHLERGRLNRMKLLFS